MGFQFVFYCETGTRLKFLFPLAILSACNRKHESGQNLERTQSKLFPQGELLGKGHVTAPINWLSVKWGKREQVFVSSGSLWRALYLGDPTIGSLLNLKRCPLNTVSFYRKYEKKSGEFDDRHVCLIQGFG